MADWSQTLQLADNPLRWGESNPILGRHPSAGRVNTPLTLGVIANGGVLFLPKTPRRIWYAAITALETFTVIHNLSLGASIGFSVRGPRSARAGRPQHRTTSPCFAHPVPGACQGGERPPELRLADEDVIGVVRGEGKNAHVGRR